MDIGFFQENPCILRPARIMRRSVSAPVAQLDRVSGYEPEGRAFESLRARHRTFQTDLFGFDFGSAP